MKLNNWTKVLIIIICLAFSLVGFLIKLPFCFRHIDKELHSIFYFIAAAFFTVLFANKNIIRHILIFILLYLFSVAIEYAQEYSNILFHKRIHGLYDKEDVHANLIGLICFSILWIIYIVILFLFNKSKTNKNHKKEL